MGQKVNPVGFRLCTHNTCDSVWYRDKLSYSKGVYEDYYVVDYIEKNFRHAAISKVLIKRKDDLFDLTLHSAKPGVIVGKKGVDIETLKTVLSKKLNLRVDVNVVEVKKPNSSANLVARNIAFQLEKRSSFRRVAKKAIVSVMRDGDVRGVKISCSGRLSGAEIARTELFKEGSMPLHKLRADVDYYVAEAHTTYGVIGVKVWIYKGDRYKSGRGLNVYSKEDEA